MSASRAGLYPIIRRIRRPLMPVEPVVEAPRPGPAETSAAEPRTKARGKGKKADQADDTAKKEE